MTNATSGQNVEGVNGAGVDADVEARPGVPMELDPPRPMGSAHWQAPARQRDPGGILRRKGLRELTPVFGATIAPRGLSGVIRRAAYGIPESRTLHWLALLVADRVDAIESRLTRGHGLPLVAALLVGVAGLALRRATERRRRGRIGRLAHALR
ncbi:MAG: hypothetical protein KF819_08835 [Labilithrix sp.]|nr:hypothetical protein [Labilithrix sp.]